VCLTNHCAARRIDSSINSVDPNTERRNFWWSLQALCMNSPARNFLSRYRRLSGRALLLESAAAGSGFDETNTLHRKQKLHINDSIGDSDIVDRH
jgi:hypothetical protein